MSLNAMKQALEALEEAVFYLSYEYTCVEKECEDAITALRAAIEQAQEWQGLTDEEKHQLNDALNLQGRFPIIDAIEAKLKEKNT